MPVSGALLKRLARYAYTLWSSCPLKSLKTAISDKFIVLKCSSATIFNISFKCSISYPNDILQNSASGFLTKALQYFMPELADRIQIIVEIVIWYISQFVTQLVLKMTENTKTLAFCKGHF